jgi:hypothetical protein
MWIATSSFVPSRLSPRCLPVTQDSFCMTMMHGRLDPDGYGRRGLKFQFKREGPCTIHKLLAHTDANFCINQCFQGFGKPLNKCIDFRQGVLSFQRNKFVKHVGKSTDPCSRMFGQKR